ncbi:MAG: RNA polymerase sigma factor RpoH [Gammaproteobacteria bacterium]|jgi:RNA polymerase sigma-32 factor
MLRELQLIDFKAQALQIPMLSEAEERTLALRWFYEQDLTAAKQLVLSHLRFVVKIARNYKGYGLPQDDLIQEGNIGLMKAVKRFDPNLGVRLATFAAYWIKSEIHNYVLRNWRLVRIATTKAQRKLFFNLRRLKKGFTALTSNEIKTIAQELNVKPIEVKEMELRLQAQDVFLDVTPEEGGETYALPTPNDAGMVYQNPEQLYIEHHEQAANKNQLQQALSKLPERTRDIILSRYILEEKTSLHELAQKYNISAERVRQIEVMGMEKLREYCRA